MFVNEFATSRAIVVWKLTRLAPLINYLFRLFINHTGCGTTIQASCRLQPNRIPETRLDYHCMLGHRIVIGSKSRSVTNESRTTDVGAMSSADKIRDLDNALEWPSTNGSKSASFGPFNSSPPTTSTSYPSPLTTTTSVSPAPLLPRHFVDAVRRGRHLPAIVRLTSAAAAGSVSLPATRRTNVIRVIPSEVDGGGDYVAFCRRTSDRSGATDGLCFADSDPQIAEINQVSRRVLETSLNKFEQVQTSGACTTRLLIVSYSTVLCGVDNSECKLRSLHL